MRRPAPLRPELAAVCRYVAPTRPVRIRRPVPPVAPAGILAELAEARGRA